MKFKITAVNTKNPSEKFEYELEGESVDSFKYFDEAEGKFFHPKEVLNNKGGFIIAPWCGDTECELKIKEETTATSRCIKGDATKGQVCICCGKEAKQEVSFAKAY